MASSTFLSLNRFTAIAIIFISWLVPVILPFIHFNNPNIEIEGTTQAVLIIDNIIAAEQTVDIPLWPKIIVIIYLLGMTGAFIFTLLGIYKMVKIIRAGKELNDEEPHILVSSVTPSPFSWGKWIVIRPEDCDDSMQMILAHENAHLRLHHWIDLALAQINAILQWYNPAAWLIMSELKTVHEYQADRAVAIIHPLHTYQLMLLKKTVGSSSPTFADSLNHSQIKLRLTMMMKPKSKATRRMAALAIPALTIISTAALSLPSVAEVISEIRNTSLSEFDDHKISNSSRGVQIQRSNSVVSTVEPIIDNSSTDEILESSETIDSHISMDADEASPSDSESTLSAEVLSNNQTGSNDYAVFVDGARFTGKLADIDTSTIKSMSVVKNDPAFPEGKIMIELYKKNEPKAAVEKMAEFKGGQKEMINFLAQNLKWPADVKLEKAERVIVKFVIDANGNVSDPGIVKKASVPSLDEEALRVVKLMSGHWIPASSDGKPVNSFFTLPVSFKPE